MAQGDKDTANSGGDAASVRGVDGRAVNLILYGPPGTGKTYRTAVEAVRLCGEAVPEDRNELMERYRELVDEGRIEMVTFHQSFSYEEFVQGLRPETSASEGAGFSLVPKDGVFKRIADRAEEARQADLDRNFFAMWLGNEKKGNENKNWWFMEESISQDVAIFLDSNSKEFGTTNSGSQQDRFKNELKIGDYIFCVKHQRVHALGRVVGDYQFRDRNENLKQRGKNLSSHERKICWEFQFSETFDFKQILSKEYKIGPNVDFENLIQKIDKEYIVKDRLERIISELCDKPEDKKVSELLASLASLAHPPRPHVIIIDEINRGNVSKIFGELITLIEPDKRLGEDGALEITLPYSNSPKKFGVPKNLHIIGTMNTADRSIALLDTALRRRFRFEEMAPDTSIPAFVAAENSTGLPLGDVLNTMNRRIEYLVDRDHRIGHAFFIGCETKTDVDAVMRDKVIPLLQEYFFDDWNRLAAVLGERDKGGNFLSCEIIEDPMGEGGEPLKSWRVRSYFAEGAYSRLVSARAASPSYMEDEA